MNDEERSAFLFLFVAQVRVGSLIIAETEKCIEKRQAIYYCDRQPMFETTGYVLRAFIAVESVKEQTGWFLHHD